MCCLGDPGDNGCYLVVLGSHTQPGQGGSNNVAGVQHRVLRARRLVLDGTILGGIVDVFWRWFGIVWFVLVAGLEG